MKKIFCLGMISFLLILGNISITEGNSKANFRCLIQLTNYGGEGAYVIASVVDAEGNYVETLYIGGPDEEWYPDLPTWFGYYDTLDDDLDGITGASIVSGGRKVTSLGIDVDQMNNGYYLRFESSVEDGEYHDQDIQLSLSDNMVGKTIEGNGYIRYVRIIKR